MELADKYKTLLSKNKVDTPLRKAHFFSQIHHESNLKPISENLNYSYEGLLKIFKNDFDVNKDRELSEIEKAFAKTLARKPELIANFVYANQNGNGDVDSGDGWRYKGRGFIQITGKENYRQLSKDTGIDYLNNPDKLLNEADSMVSALWFWNKKGLNKYADRDDIKAVTKRINGRYNGLSQRIELLKKYKEKFNV